LRKYRHVNETAEILYQELFGELNCTVRELYVDQSGSDRVHINRALRRGRVQISGALKGEGSSKAWTGVCIFHPYWK